MANELGPYRSSTLYILFRIWVIFTAPIVILGTLGGVNPIATTIGWGLFVAFVMSWSFPAASIIMRLAGPILWGDEWHRFRQSGGRPLLDALPWPFNSVSYTVRVGGLPEPKTDYVPPPSWHFQCPSCGARNEEQFCICWHCGADWLNGNGEGHPDHWAPIDQSVLPVTHEQPSHFTDSEGNPFVLDENGKPYWFYEDGTPYYFDEKEVVDPVDSDPSIVPMTRGRQNG